MTVSPSAAHTIAIDPHPLLDSALFSVTMDKPLGQLSSPATLTDLLGPSVDARMQSSDAIKKAVRLLLRHGGYKPSGRGKPASEYLHKAAAEDMLNPINPLVDACNVVSLHSGLPISIVDLDLAKAPFRIGIAKDEASYVFNASGQEIKLAGLLNLHDAEGACANAVKDCQRTKTHADTTRALCVVWGTTTLPGRALAAAEWYRELLHDVGARTEPVGVA